MFWLWLLIAAWGGFTAGVFFIAWWSDAHQPRIDVDEFRIDDVELAAWARRRQFPTDRVTW